MRILGDTLIFMALAFVLLVSWMGVWRLGRASIRERYIVTDTVEVSPLRIEYFEDEYGGHVRVYRNSEEWQKELMQWRTVWRYGER